MSIQWGDVPSWVVACSTTGAFVAAGFAARWTAKTAKSADDQVHAAQAQVAAARAQADATREQLLVAQAEAEREREAVQAAERRFLQTQLDARAPVVYARAKPGCDLPGFTSSSATGSWGRAPLMAIRQSEAQGNDPDWLRRLDHHVTERMTLEEDDQRFIFVQYVTLEFVNCSGVPARIDITKPAGGELSIRQGEALVIPPHEARSLAWWRRLGWAAVATEAGVNSAEVSFVQLEFCVRDLGMAVRDHFAFNLDTRYFERDGSRLIVKPEPPFPWSEVFAGERSPRAYERLDAPGS